MAFRHLIKYRVIFNFFHNQAPGDLFVGQNTPSTVGYMGHVFILKIFVFLHFSQLFFSFSQISCKVIIGFGSKFNRLWAGWQATCVQNFKVIQSKLCQKNHFENQNRKFNCDLVLDPRGSRSLMVNKYPTKLVFHALNAFHLCYILRYQIWWKKLLFVYDVIVTSTDIIFTNWLQKWIAMDFSSKMRYYTIW